MKSTRLRAIAAAVATVLALSLAACNDGGTDDDCSGDALALVAADKPRPPAPKAPKAKPHKGAHVDLDDCDD